MLETEISQDNNLVLKLEVTGKVYDSIWNAKQF